MRIYETANEWNGSFAARYNTKRKYTVNNYVSGASPLFSTDIFMVFIVVP